MASDGFFLFGKFQGVAPLLVTGQNYISRDKLPAPFGGPPGSTLTPTHHIGGAFFSKNGADNGGGASNPTQIVTAAVNRQVDKGRR